MIKNASFYEGNGIAGMSALAYGVRIHIYQGIHVPISPTHIVNTSPPHPF